MTTKAATTIPATGHKTVKDAAVAATCTKAGKSEGSHCSVCGTVIKAQSTTKALGHDWVNKAGQAPTKTTPGYTDYQQCSRCGTETGKTQRTLKAGAWSGWSTTAVSATNTRDVETKTETEKTYKTYYNYNRYKYWNSTYQTWYFSYANVGGGQWEYKQTEAPLGIIKYPDGVPEYEGVWFNLSTTQAEAGTKSVTYYRYRDYTE